MVTLNDALLDLVETGQVEPREAWRKIREDRAARVIKAASQVTSPARSDGPTDHGPGREAGWQLASAVRVPRTRVTTAVVIPVN